MYMGEMYKASKFFWRFVWSKKVIWEKGEKEEQVTKC